MLYLQDPVGPRQHMKFRFEQPVLVDSGLPGDKIVTMRNKSFDNMVANVIHSGTDGCDKFKGSGCERVVEQAGYVGKFRDVAMQDSINIVAVLVAGNLGTSPEVGESWSRFTPRPDSDPVKRAVMKNTAMKATYTLLNTKLRYSVEGPGKVKAAADAIRASLTAGEYTKARGLCLESAGRLKEYSGYCEKETEQLRLLLIDVVGKCRDEMKTAVSEERCRTLIQVYTTFADALKPADGICLTAIVKSQDANADAGKAKVAELRKVTFQTYSKDIESKMKAAQLAKRTVDMADWEKFLPELKRMKEKEVQGQPALVERMQLIAEEANRTLEQRSDKEVAKDTEVAEWTATWEVLRKARQFLPDDKQKKIISDTGLLVVDACQKVVSGFTMITEKWSEKTANSVHDGLNAITNLEKSSAGEVAAKAKKYDRKYDRKSTKVQGDSQARQRRHPEPQQEDRAGGPGEAGRCNQSGGGPHDDRLARQRVG